MREPKHLPLDQWSAADIEAFASAFAPGDIFDETAGPGAHLAEGTRRLIRTVYRRWLGFLKQHYPDDLRLAPADRISPDRMRTFIDHLAAEVGSTTVAIVIDNLCYAARLIAPATDWRWLASLKARLAARAKPEDRFDRLVPPWQTFDFGIELMEEAITLLITGHKRRHEIQYRDGLLLAILSLWLLRRRSLAAPTVSRHLDVNANGVTMVLFPEDTKAKRAESLWLPEQLVPYFMHYLKVIRPRLVGANEHDGLWASYKGCPLSPGRIYDIVRARTKRKFGKAMGLHDFRRAAATFIAMEAPDKIGWIPGVLQHTSPEVGERHYNLARSAEASRRFAAHVARTRDWLQPISHRAED
jgi:integrase/recombinase XerD